MKKEILLEKALKQALSNANCKKCKYDRKCDRYITKLSCMEIYLKLLDEELESKKH